MLPFASNASKSHGGTHLRIFRNRIMSCILKLVIATWKLCPKLNAMWRLRNAYIKFPSWFNRNILPNTKKKDETKTRVPSAASGARQPPHITQRRLPTVAAHVSACLETRD